MFSSPTVDGITTNYRFFEVMLTSLPLDVFNATDEDYRRFEVMLTSLDLPRELAPFAFDLFSHAIWCAEWCAEGDYDIALRMLNETIEDAEFMSAFAISVLAYTGLCFEASATMALIVFQSAVCELENLLVA